MTAIKWFFRLVVLTLVVILAFSNQHTVSVFGLTHSTEWQAPMAWVITLAWLAGLLIGWLFMLPYWWRARRLQGKLQTLTQPVPSVPQNAPVSAAGSPTAVASIHPRSADWRAPGDDLGI